MLKVKRFLHKAIHTIINGTLAKRLILLLFIGIIIPITLITLINIQSTFQKMINQYEEKNLSTVAFLSEILGDYYKDINNLPMTFLTSNDVVRPILGGARDGYINSPEVYDYLKKFSYSRNDIDSIYLYTAGNETLSYLDRTNTSNSINTKVDKALLGDYIPDYDKLDINHRFYISELKEHRDSGKKYFTQNQLIIDFDNKSMLAVLSINLNTNFFDQQNKNLNLKKDESVVVLDKNYKLLYQFGVSKVAAQISNNIFYKDKSKTHGIKYIVVNEKKYLTTYSWNSDRQYLFIKIIPVNYIYHEVISLFYSDFLILVLLLIIFIIISTGISRSITTPIRGIVESMRAIERGKFDVKIDIKTHSKELVLLIDKFNLMAEEIDRLFNETFKMEMAQKTAEFNALQAQINPHFLYNTLQTIQGMALKRNAYEIDKMVNALGDILKYSLRNENDSNTVLLREELEYVDKFLLIQRFKYINNLQVDIRFEEAVLELKVPKMLLQPLIENCFIHGFDSNKSMFILEIECVKSNNNIVIKITDNGKGIETERLLKINGILEQKVFNKDYSGIEIGLANVNYRLGILFQSQAKMEVYSTPFEYTTIIITIPFREELL